MGPSFFGVILPVMGLGILRHCIFMSPCESSKRPSTASRSHEARAKRMARNAEVVSLRQWGSKYVWQSAASTMNVNSLLCCGRYIQNSRYIDR